MTTTAYRKTTAERVKKARMLSHNFCQVTGRNSKDLATSIRVPGSNGKSYEVIIRRQNSIVTTECRLEIGNHGHQDCKGNGNGLCYHSMAAMMVAANEAGKILAVCASKENAEKTVKFGGRVIGLKSQQSERVMWSVVK